MEEKGVEELQKNWHLANREQIRQKFVERHEVNILREVKAGIKKDYVSLNNQMTTQDIGTTLKYQDMGTIFTINYHKTPKSV